MKHLNEWNVFKNKEEGNKIASHIIEIIKNENIPIVEGLYVIIDNKIYSFDNLSIMFDRDYELSIYDKSQKVTSGKWKGVILGKPISKYKISKKYYNEIKKLHKQQNNYKSDYKSDLDELSDLNRTSKKYNL